MSFMEKSVKISKNIGKNYVFIIFKFMFSFGFFKFITNFIFVIKKKYYYIRSLLLVLKSKLHKKNFLKQKLHKKT